jgi:hypothetical protein
MLDFMHDVSVPLAVCTNTAVEMYQLGHYFYVVPICNQAQQFWETDMTLDNCHVYYTRACGVHLEPVLDAVKKTSVDALVTHGASRFSELVACVAIEFWQEIFASARVHKARIGSRRVCILISQIFRRVDVDWEGFKKLITSRCLNILIGRMR